MCDNVKSLLRHFPLICCLLMATVPLQPCFSQVCLLVTMAMWLDASYELNQHSASSHTSYWQQNFTENWTASFEVECKTNCWKIWTHTWKGEGAFHRTRSQFLCHQGHGINIWSPIGPAMSPLHRGMLAINVKLSCLMLRHEQSCFDLRRTKQQFSS